MDDTIMGIPSVRGPLNITHGRRDNRRRGEDFEEALAERGGDPEPEPSPETLKGRDRQRRKVDQGRRHVDVLA